MNTALAIVALLLTQSHTGQTQAGSFATFQQQLQSAVTISGSCEISSNYADTKEKISVDFSYQKTEPSVFWRIAKKNGLPYLQCQYDGTDFWEYHADINAYVERSFDKSELGGYPEYLPLLFALSAQVKQSDTIPTQKAATFQGRKVTAVSFEELWANGDPKEVVTLYLSGNSGTLVGFTVEVPAFEMITTGTYRNLKISDQARGTLALPTIPPNARLFKSETQLLPTKGQPAPSFTVTTATGQKVSLKDLLKDKKIILLNFWFVGCRPCRQEFPNLVALQKEFGERLKIVAVNYGDSVNDASTFFKKEGLPLTLTFADRGPSSIVARYGIQNYPTSFLIDSEGVLREIFGGIATKEDLEAFRRKLSKVTGES